VAQQRYAEEEEEGHTHAAAGAHRLGDGAGADMVAEVAGRTQVADAGDYMQVEVGVEHTLTGAGPDRVAGKEECTHVDEAGVDMLVEVEVGHTLTGAGADMVAAAGMVVEEGTRTLDTEVPHRLAAVAEQGLLVTVEQKRQIPEEGQQPSSTDLGAAMKNKQRDHLRQGIATQYTYSSKEQRFFSAVIMKDGGSEMKIRAMRIVVKRVRPGAQMPSFQVEDMMVEPGLVCLRDTRTLSKTLSETLRVSKIAANREVTKHRCRLILPDLALGFGVVALCIQNMIPVGFCKRNEIKNEPRTIQGNHQANAMETNRDSPVMSPIFLLFTRNFHGALLTQMWP
jgi:hypothetical protein